jgi:hypothetical protein
VGSKGSNTTKETKNYQADPRAAAYASWLTGQAQNLPGQGEVPLQGVQGFNQDQTNAFQGVRDAQGTYNPYAQRAEALNAEYGRGLNTQGIQDMYSQLSAGPLAQLANQQRAQFGQATRNAVQSAGGTGASRIGVAQGNLANQQNLATGALQSGLLGQSINAYQNDLAMKGAAAAQEANLGMGHTAQNYNDLGQLYGVGAAQQGLGQAGLDAQYQQQVGRYQNPYQNLQYQNQVLSGIGNVFKGTETTEKEVPEASPWGTLLGAAGAGLGAYFGGPAGSKAGSSIGSWLGGSGKGSASGGRINYADGGAVGNPFAMAMGGGALSKRSELFNQMVEQHFPKYNQMTQQAGIKAGHPFGQMAPQQPSGGFSGGFAEGGEVDPLSLLRDRFASEAGRTELGNISRMADQRMGEEPDTFSQRFDEAPGGPDLYNPGIVADRNALRDAGYNSPYRTETMSEGDDTPPLPQSRPPFEMFPNRNPLGPSKPYGEALAYAGEEEGGGGNTPAGGRQLPPMPDTAFKAPERNPWGAVINAAAAALSRHGERTASGHLMSGTVFGQAARAAGAGLDAGMKTHAAGREEDRKNYDEKLKGERLAESAAMSRLPYVEMTAAQREQARIASKVADREEWRYLGPSAVNPGKSVFFNQRNGESEERDVGVGAKPINRVLPSPIRKDLEAKGSVISQVSDLEGGFRDDYGGPAPEWVGSVKNYAARQFGIGNKDAATWWQQYDQYANVARNKLFGSALTATEYNAWKAATIVPGMDPTMIRENLRIQKEQTEKAARKLGLSLTQEGYGRETIETQLGIDLGGQPSQQAPAPTPTPAPAASANQEAIDWIAANPNDPRVPAIKKKLGLP